MILERNNFVDIKQITNDLKGSPLKAKLKI